LSPLQFVAVSTVAVLVFRHFDCTPYKIGHTEFAGKALVKKVLSAINAVSEFMEGVVVYLVDSRMWLVANVRSVLMDSGSRSQGHGGNND